MGTDLVKVSARITHNIQGVWQRDPSVLHDSVEDVEREAGSERVSRDESEKFRLRGVRGDSPSIPTSSNNASS